MKGNIGDNMLEIKNISKNYKTGDFTQHALNGVSIKFRKNEFVSILGPSGSGKTTLLNILGGLDRYDKGDLIINNKSTKKFKDTNWDSYRNNCVGFIFQSYNLISHISILENVELSTTLSGYSRKRRKKLAIEALKNVGLERHIHKKPNQLSGGQMQRVAIARALVNNPSIILADEPTGALDSKTSVQIMELIKEISKDKLVIMVTHNNELAKKYSTRVIELKDGEIEKDSKPIKETEKDDANLKIKKTKMSYRSAISLSFNNLRTKKGRTFITSLASSIGIIGIALILSLSNGFKIKIDEFEKDTLSQAPIIISKQSVDMKQMTKSKKDNLKEYTKKKKIYKQDIVEKTIRENRITNEYIDYVKNIDEKLIDGISYTDTVRLNMLVKDNNKVKTVETQNLFTSLPSSLNGNKSKLIDNNFEIIEGEYSNKLEDIYVLVDSKNRISETTLKAIGYNSDSVDFKDIIGKEFKVVLNNDYYEKIGSSFVPNSDYDELYDNKNNITLKIKGIIRGKKDNKFAEMSGSGLLYTNKFISYFKEQNKNSEIVKKQRDIDYNIFTGEVFDTDTKEGVDAKNLILTALGDDMPPMAIQLFPKDFKTKEKVVKYLDKYNKRKSKDDKILYLDQAEMVTSLSGNIMDAITIVLIAFSSISLVVSSIMVGIITYTSVLERTKEIGILRAIGARKKDISRVFKSEVLIIGFFSGVLGILIARLLIIPINKIIENLADLPDVANLNPVHAIILITISVVLTLIGGIIPARVAAKKDPVIALRTE